MDGQEFKVRGRQMVDYIIQYLEVEISFSYNKYKNQITIVSVMTWGRISYIQIFLRTYVDS